MANLDVDLLRASFEMIIDREPELTARFYEHLFSDHPEARALFGRRSERAQQTMLRDALVAVMDHLEDATWLRSTLHTLGAAHAGYGVTVPMYDWVGGALVSTLAEIAGDDWTPRHAEQWGAAYTVLAEMMQEGAEAVAPTG